MKKFVLEFLRRGFSACGLGPIVLAILYLSMHQTSAVEYLSVEQVCLGIFSLSGLAFVVGGMNVIYQLERLPLMGAILIHGVVLYAAYLFTYLLNDWLQLGKTPILIFSVIFVLGYFAIWAVIYFITRQNAKTLNQKLRQKQQHKK